MVAQGTETVNCWMTREREEIPRKICIVGKKANEPHFHSAATGEAPHKQGGFS